MKFIGFERELEAIEWAKNRIDIEGDIGFCRAMSTVDSNNDFALVIVFSNFSKRNVDMHTAAVAGAQWATLKAGIMAFNAAFHYVFSTLGAVRVTGLVRAKNTAARRFDEHLGFKLEGIMQQAFEDDDLCLYGFLKTDFEKHSWYRSL